jgi:hypothetical protein
VDGAGVLLQLMCWPQCATHLKCGPSDIDVDWGGSAGGSLHSTMRGKRLRRGTAEQVIGKGRAVQYLDGCIEVALADPAPRSYDVANDSDGDAFGGGRHEKLCLKQLATEGFLKEAMRPNATGDGCCSGGGGGGGGNSSPPKQFWPQLNTQMVLD